MTKKLKLRTGLAVLIAVALAGGYLIAAGQEPAPKDVPAGFAAFH
jgi:hypothetical protein